jgi:hypothetical protein
MSEKDFGNALLRGEHPIDVNALTHGVLRRDRWRMWVLGTLCVIAWMLVVMLPWATILPMLAKVIDHFAHVDPFASPPATTKPQSPDMVELLQIVKVGTMATFIGSIASMFMAALCTVSLIILSRRATLRQVNARLAEISDQLKALVGTERKGMP